MIQEKGNWVAGPRLPVGFQLTGHSICPRIIGDNSHFIVAGGERGWNEDSYSEDVLMYDFDLDTWKELPGLPEARAYGTCAPYTKVNGDQIILYAGQCLLVI